MNILYFAWGGYDLQGCGIEKINKNIQTYIYDIDEVVVKAISGKEYKPGMSITDSDKPAVSINTIGTPEIRIQ